MTISSLGRWSRYLRTTRRAGPASHTSAANATIADAQATGSIVNDEPRAKIGNVTKKEGRSGTTSFVFAVTLSRPYDVAVTMNFATANGTAKVSDDDYAATSGTLTFVPGQTTGTITVRIRGDTKRKQERDETFFVRLKRASNALILDGQGGGTILNDDGAAASARGSKGICSLALGRKGRTRRAAPA